MDKTIVTPCYGCNDRTEDCHCICERYKEYEAARDKRYEEKRKRMQYLGDICYMQRERKGTERPKTNREREWKA